LRMVALGWTTRSVAWLPRGRRTCLRVPRWVPVCEVDADAVVTLVRQLLLANADRPEQSTTGELARGTQHWVYNRAGRPCRRCGERVIRSVQGADVYARNTYYCPRCQPDHPAPP
jgi:endonuclease-8